MMDFGVDSFWRPCFVSQVMTKIPESKQPFTCLDLVPVPSLGSSISFPSLSSLTPSYLRLLRCVSSVIKKPEILVL